MTTGHHHRSFASNRDGAPSGRRGFTWISAAFLALVALLPAATGQAQALEPNVPGPADEGRVHGALGGRFGVAKLSEDWHLTITPTLFLEIRDLALTRNSPLFDAPQAHSLRFSFEVPLTTRVGDRFPHETTPAFRHEHWDERAEYMRVLRWLEYGSPYDGVYVRGGELPNVRIGHRTIVDAYDNGFDSDHFQWGVQHSLNTVYGGLDAFIDNVTDPDVMGARAYIRPWGIDDPEGSLRRLAFGVTVAADQAAPTRILQAEPDVAYPAIPSRDLLPNDTNPTAILGWDAEYQLVVAPRATMTPYLDVNTHFARGTGLHAGSFFGFKLSDEVVMDMRAEYRLLGGAYQPAYFGRVYEVERLAFRTIPGETLRAPKFAWTDAVREGARNGYYAELGFNFSERVFLSAGWEDQTGANNNAAWAQLRIPALSVLQFGAYFLNTSFEGPDGLFDMSNAVVVAEARVSPLPWLYADTQIRRRWEVDRAGQYEPVNDWSIGAGVSFGF